MLACAEVEGTTQAAAEYNSQISTKSSLNKETFSDKEEVPVLAEVVDTTHATVATESKLTTLKPSLIKEAFEIVTGSIAI